MKIKNKTLLYTIISSIVFFVGFLSVFVWYVNHLSQNETITTFIIQKQIQRLLDLDSEVEKPSAYLDWDLHYKIKANRLVFKEHDGNPLISVDNIKLSVFLPMMLLRKIDITKMSGDNMYVNFERYENKKINIIEIFNITGFFKIYFNNATISVNNYLFDFTDRAYRPNKFMSIRGEDILITKFSLKKYLQLTMNGDLLYKNNNLPFFISTDLKLKGKKPKYNLSVEFSNAYFKDFFDYAKEFYPDLTRLDGVGSARIKVFSGKYFNIDSDIYKLHFANKKYPSFINYDKPFNFNSRFSYENKKFLIDEANLISNDFDVSANGMIYDFFNQKNKIVNLFVGIKNNSNAKEMLQFLPSGLAVLRGAIDRAKKYQIDGNINGELQVNLPYITGKIDVKNAKFQVENAISTGDADLIFNKDTMNINTKLFMHNQQDTLDVKGNIKFVKPVVLNLHVASSKNIYLPEAIKSLNMASDIIKFPTGPVEFLNIKKGYGDVSLDIQGTPPKVFLYGEMNGNNIQVGYPGLFGFVENGTGKIEFLGNLIQYNNLQGYRQNVLISSYGETKIHEDGLTHLFLNINNIPLKTAQVFIDNSSLLKDVSKGLNFISNTKGNGALSLCIKSQKGMKVPQSQGHVTLFDTEGDIRGLAYRAKHVSGTVDFDNSVAVIDISGYVNDIYTKITGNVKHDVSELNIINTNADIVKAHELIYNSPLFYKIKNSFNDFHEFSGKINTNIKISGNFLTQQISSYSVIDILEGRLKYLDIDEYINIKGGKIFANDTHLVMDNITGIVFDSDFILEGDVFNFGFNNEKSKIKFGIQDVDITNISKITDTKLITKDASNQLKNFKFESGIVDVYTEVINKIPESIVTFQNSSFEYIPTQDKFYVNAGKLLISDITIGMDKLDIDLKNSTYVASGNIKNYNTSNPVFDINVSANVDSTDFNSIFSKQKDFPINLAGKIYFNADFIGDNEKWNLKTRAMLEDGANIFFKGANLGSKFSRYVFADIDKINDGILINKAELFSSSDALLNKDNKPLIDVKGEILDITTKAPRFKNLEINFNDLTSISLINILVEHSKNDNPFISEGQMRGHVSINGKIPDVNLLGDVYIQNANIPSLNTKIQDMFLLFKPNIIEIPSSDIIIVNSHAQVKGSLINKLQTPFVITDMEISSSSVNYDEILESFSKLVEVNSKDKNIEKIPTPPVIIEKGKIKLDELIYSGLLCKNMTADFSFTKDWFCNINDFYMKVTTGEMSGDIAYNIYTTDLYGSVNTKNMMANALASTFLNLPNEIYGDLSGEVSFTTRGATNKEIVKHLSGTADFSLLDGRMLRMGSVEYMLKFANILKGGISRLNLNAIINIVAPKTGYFDTIDGEIQIQNGIISTDKITFASKELELFLTGTYDMNNSDVNATIIGQIPKEAQEAVIKLGYVGDISLSSLKRRITKQLKKEEKIFLFNPNSYLNSITTLKHDNDKYRFFLIILKGDLYKEKYVKTFKWIKTK